jgi:manganese/iron transport system permease protein
MLVSAIIALLSTVIGLYLSYYANLPTGPAIVLISTGCFVLALGVAPAKGLIRRWRNPAEGQRAD